MSTNSQPIKSQNSVSITFSTNTSNIQAPIESLAQSRASTPSPTLQYEIDFIQKTLTKIYTYPHQTIDGIIKNRREEHASSFGYKYLKDTMDNTESKIVWAACLIPRLIIAPIYALGKMDDPFGFTSSINPVNWFRGLLGFIAIHAISISPEARKEQAIRTFVEGKEKQKLISDHDEKVYDCNKEYEGGLLKKIESSVIGKQVGPGNYDTKAAFNGNKEEKEQFIKELETIKTAILKALPHAASTSWFNKLSSRLEELKKMPCSLSD